MRGSYTPLLVLLQKAFEGQRPLVRVHDQAEFIRLIHQLNRGTLCEVVSPDLVRLHMPRRRHAA